MSEECEVVAYVSSRVVAEDVAQWRVPMVVRAGIYATLTSTETRQAVRYTRRLEQDQSKIVEHAREQANEAGYKFRVVDLGRIHPLMRVIQRWRLGVEELPVVLWKGTCVPRRGAEEDARQEFRSTRLDSKVVP